MRCSLSEKTAATATTAAIATIATIAAIAVQRSNTFQSVAIFSWLFREKEIWTFTNLIISTTRKTSYICIKDGQHKLLSVIFATHSSTLLWARQIWIQKSSEDHCQPIRHIFWKLISGTNHLKSYKWAYIIFVIFSPHGTFLATIFLHTKSALIATKQISR